MDSVRRSTPAHIAWLLPAGTLFFMFGILLGRIAETWVPALGALALTLLAAMLMHRRLRMAALLLAAICTGAVLGWFAWNPALPPEGTYTVTGTVIQEVAVKSSGQVQTILQDVTLNGEPFRRGAYWTFYLDEDETLPTGLLPGATVTLSARVYHPGGQDNPSGFDFREYLLQRGVTIGLYGADLLTVNGTSTPNGWIARLRHNLSMDLMDVMGEEHGGYAAAMLLGSRDFISDSDRAAFSKLGIAHILSVSGYHVGVLAGLLLFLLRPLRLTRKRRILAQALALGAYCLLTGGNAPVVRASLLLLWRECTRLRHHQVLPMHILCVTACVQLIFSPVLLTSASFQLTYCAMLGLLLVQPRLRRLITCRTRWSAWLWEGFCASLSAQIGILLPLLYWFGELPLLAIFLNIPVMTLSGGVMALYWATLGSLPIPFLRNILGAAASWLTGSLVSGVRTLAALGIGSLWTRQADLFTAAGWVLLMLGLSAGLPARLARHRRAMVILGTVLIALLLLPLPQEEVAYTQFSVGDADAAILQDRDYTVVIDTGEDGQTIAEYLHKRRTGVDLLILAHLHSDHAGGLQALLDANIPVDICCLPAGAESARIDPGLVPLLEAMAATGTEIRHLQRGDVIPLPSGSLTALWPQAELVVPGQDANHSCLALLAEIRGTTLLLTADLTGRYEHYVQTAADVLKVAHHGSTASTAPAFLQAVDPTLLLLSNGSESRLTSMEERRGDIPMYSTQTCGAITLHFTSEGMFEVETFLLPE